MTSSAAPYTRAGSVGVDVAGPPVEAREKAITVFYDGQACSCDVTEIQARAIICTAKRATEQAKREEQQHYCSSSLLLPLPLDVERLSMKKSLQLFLQRRRKPRGHPHHDGGGGDGDDDSSSSSCNY